MSKKPNRAVQYRIANEKFLEQKAQEEGVIALESGILMRQLEKGTGGSRPQAALLRMHVGDRYEVFIPAKYGYGSMKLDGIPAWSTLCFEIELLKFQ